MENHRPLKGTIIAIVISFLLLTGPALSYFDEGRAHAAINDVAYERFVKDWMPNDPYLKDCLIDSSKMMPGPAWDPDMGISYLGQIDPETRSKNAKDWLKSGGFSADEPEVPKGIRHFYTPIGPINYITDFNEEYALLTKFKATCLGLTTGLTALGGPGVGLGATGACAII